MIQVFGTEWFKKYNKLIVKLAKLPFIGERIFCIKKYGFKLDTKDIIEIKPNAVVEDCKLMWTKCVKVNGKWVAYDCTNSLHNRLIKKEYKEKLLPTRKQHIFVRNEFALRLQSVFYPIWITFHIWDIITRPIPQLNLGFDTLTVYPDASSGSDSVDGWVNRAGDESFSSIRTGAGTGSSPTSGGNGCFLQASLTSNQYIDLGRNIFTFKTSSLTSGATISAAVLSLYGNGKYDGLGSPALHVCATTPTAVNNLQNSDYGQFGSTSFANVTYANWANSYNDFTLSAGGISNINKSGVSCFGSMLSWDILNNTTGLTWGGSNTFTQIVCRFSDYGSNKPKLVVTYTVVVAPTVTTQSATNVAQTSCTGNGNITATGGANATRRGFCYKVGTSGDPTVADSTAYDDGDFSTGAYTKGITGLTAGTGYRVRAYAINSVGVGYGDTVQVTTKAGFIPQIIIM